MYDADEYAAWLITQELADNTVRNYRCLYQRWLDWCATHDRAPDLLHPADVREWSRSVHGSRSMLAQARAAIGHAAELHGVDVEHAQAIPVPTAPRNHTRALSPSDAAQLEAHAHNAGLAGTAVLVGLYTAARRIEIAGMTWDGIDLDRGRLSYDRPKHRDRHTIPLHPVLAEHLSRRMTDERWLFPGRWGGHVSPATIWRWVLDVAEDAGVGRVKPHELRATCLTEANDRSGDLRAVQHLAGHSSPNTTAIYTRVYQERLGKVVNMLDYGREPEAASAQ